MTDRKQALTDLLAKVEAGEFDIPAGEAHEPYKVHFRRCCEISLPQNCNPNLIAWDAYNGSLDAIKALHEAVLPEYGAQIDLDGITVVEHRAAWPFDPHHGENVTPARAWLIAIIKALIAEETQ